jgi:hypothetical protein
MNIFFLSENPLTAARYHADTHVVKMILESAQILCSVINQRAGSQVTPYKTTHLNHPCTVWAGKSFENAQWLLHLARALNDEYKHRFCHDNNHKSYDMLLNTDMLALLREYLPATGFTPPALAMPDEYKTDCPVASYRAYYRTAKSNLHKYTKQSFPDWLISA